MWSTGGSVAAALKCRRKALRVVCLMLKWEMIDWNWRGLLGIWDDPLELEII